ncbi:MULTISPECIES: hypothetical protein [unclassified Arthrobacter]|uniref:hypothetical protein n=1 Tax=unclassified Arthrobacter TaxID=235627 RepID=UPI002E05FC2A|nr:MULTISPECIES: hypothetical protein [unclassified Arthrobacter]MEC5192568.1 hypothetical protein [Arthrobacter sp. MP_M4]MEC5204052.1 hypothetical protein [Arthrobacter sp. MP_M7]
MNNSLSCSGSRWCTRADTLLGVEGIDISSVTATENGRFLRVETGETLSGCPEWGVIAIGHGRRQYEPDLERCSYWCCRWWAWWHRGGISGAGGERCPRGDFGGFNLTRGDHEQRCIA